MDDRRLHDDLDSLEHAVPASSPPPLRSRHGRPRRLVPVGLALVAGVLIGLWGAQVLRPESPAHEVAAVPRSSATPLEVQRLSWVERPAPFSAAHVAAVGARLVATGGKDGADGAWYSDDGGESWASASVSRGPDQADWQLGPFASHGAHLVSLGSRPAAATGNDANRIPIIFTSDDRGASWKAIASATPPDVHGETVGVAFGAGRYVAVINPVATAYTLRPQAWTSTDGLSWNRVDADALGFGYVDGVVGNGRIVAVGSAVTRDGSNGVATAWWSEDGTDWHAVQLGTADGTLAVTVASTGFVAAGKRSNGALVVWTSTDGTTWEALPSNVQDWDRVTDVAAGSMGIVISGTTRGAPPAASLAFIPRQGGPATVASDIKASPQLVTALPRRFVAFGPMCPPRALCFGDLGQSMIIGTPESAETTPAPQAFDIPIGGVRAASTRQNLTTARAGMPGGLLEPGWLPNGFMLIGATYIETDAGIESVDLEYRGDGNYVHIWQTRASPAELGSKDPVAQGQALTGTDWNANPLPASQIGRAGVVAYGARLSDGRTVSVDSDLDVATMRHILDAFHLDPSRGG